MTWLSERLLVAGLTSAAGAFCLALLAILATRVWRRPALAHALWLLVLLKFISPALVRLPLVSVSTPSEPAATEAQDLLPNEAATPPTAPTEDAAVPTRAVAYQQRVSSAKDPPPDKIETHGRLRWPKLSVSASLSQSFRAWSRPISLVWLGGSCAWFALATVRLRRLARLLRRTSPAADALQAEVAGVASFLGVRRPPSVRVTTATVSPFVWSLFGKSLVVLPSALVESLDNDERRTLLAHELAHLERRDHLVRWLELVVVGLFWWQPVAWFARRQLQHAAEACCDALVVRRFPDQTRAYARALLKTVDFLAGENTATPIAGAAFGQAYLIQRRFEMILHGRGVDRLSRASRVAVCLFGLALLATSVGALRADDSEPAKSGPTAAPAESAAAIDADRPAEDGAPADLEARLRRLEETVKALREARGATPATPTKPTVPAMGPAPVAIDFAPPSAREVSDRVARQPEVLGKSKPADGAKQPDNFDTVLKSVEQQAHLLETNKNRAAAAKINLEAVQKAYDANTVTLDLLLDAQRRLLISEVEYIDATFRLAAFLPDRERKRAQAQLTLEAHIKARDAALATWRKVKALYDVGAKGGEAENEGQAREQYFLFRDQTEKAVTQVQEAK